MNNLIPSFKKISDCEVKYGYVDENNKVKIPYIYEYCYPFNYGLAGVRDYKTHLIGFIDKNNNKKIDFLYDYIHSFNDGYAWVCKDNLWGLIDLNGNYVIPHEYLKACSYKNGFTIVQNIDSKWGVVDISNTPIIPLKYDWIISNDNNKFYLFENNKWKSYVFDKDKCINFTKKLKLNK